MWHSQLCPHSDSLFQYLIKISYQNSSTETTANSERKFQISLHIVEELIIGCVPIVCSASREATQREAHLPFGVVVD